jgi:uncharacterized OsmC-like protein
MARERCIREEGRTAADKHFDSTISVHSVDAAWTHAAPQKESQMVTTTTVNGVDTRQLIATIDAVKNSPELAHFQFRTESRWNGGARSTTSIESFYGAGSKHQHTRAHTLDGDEPEVLLGSDTAPNAVETLLGSLASCLAVGYAYNAAAQGIALEDVAFQIEGDLDLHAFLGLRDDVRPGFQQIRVRYQVESPANRDQLVALCDYVQRTSPVLDMIANKVPVSVELTD